LSLCHLLARPHKVSDLLELDKYEMLGPFER
jgi:hypothetical protein